LEQSTTETASSHINSLIDNFEAYFPNQQAIKYIIKVVDCESIRQTSSTGALGHKSKRRPMLSTFISRIKHAEFWLTALDGLRKDLETIPLPWGFDGLSLPKSPKPPKLKYETI